MKKILFTISILLYLNGCASINTPPATESFEIPREEYNTFSDEFRNYYDQLTPEQKTNLEIQRRVAGCKNRIRAIDAEINELTDELRLLEKNEMMPFIVERSMLEKERAVIQSDQERYKRLLKDK